MKLPFFNVSEMSAFMSGKPEVGRGNWSRVYKDYKGKIYILSNDPSKDFMAFMHQQRPDDPYLPKIKKIGTTKHFYSEFLQRMAESSVTLNIFEMPQYRPVYQLDGEIYAGPLNFPFISDDIELASSKKKILRLLKKHPTPHILIEDIWALQWYFTAEKWHDRVEEKERWAFQSFEYDHPIYNTLSAIVAGLLTFSGVDSFDEIDHPWLWDIRFPKSEYDIGFDNIATDGTGLVLIDPVYRMGYPDHISTFGQGEKRGSTNSRGRSERSLIQQIQRFLKTTDAKAFLKPEYRVNGKHPYYGHCYVASEVLYHVMGGEHSGYDVYQMNHEGSSHWFLMNESGRVLDPTWQHCLI